MDLYSPSQLLKANLAFLKIREAVEARIPFSFIRIGDGEGLLLSLSERSWIQDIQYLSSHFGWTQVTFGDLLRLRDSLRKVLNSANLLGIREDILSCRLDPELVNGSSESLEREVKARFALRPVDRYLPAAGCRRLALTNLALAELDRSPDSAFTSAWAHWDFLLSGDLYRLLQTQGEIGLITCHGSVAALIETLFPLKVVQYQVPDMFADDEAKIPGAHFPQRFDSLRSELHVDRPGMVFLVGAGICGKVYCHWIKERGGIALDMGSVLDTWIGIASRPAVMAHKFPEVRRGEVPADLLLNRHAIDRLCGKNKDDAS